MAYESPGQKVPCSFIFKGLQFHSQPVGGRCESGGVAYVTIAHRQMEVGLGRRGKAPGHTVGAGTGGQIDIIYISLGNYFSHFSWLTPLTNFANLYQIFPQSPQTYVLP